MRRTGNEGIHERVDPGTRNKVVRKRAVARRAQQAEVRQQLAETCPECGGEGESTQGIYCRSCEGNGTLS